MKKTIVVAAAATIGGYFLLKKGKEIFADYSQIKVKVDRVHSVNIPFLDVIFNEGKDLNFEVDVTLINPTATGLTIATSGLVVLKQISFFTPDGSYLGKSVPLINAINLPANSTLQVLGIPSVIPVQNIGIALDQFDNMDTIKTEIIIEVAGKEFTI